MNDNEKFVRRIVVRLTARPVLAINRVELYKSASKPP
jgi:hypothetical protein